MKSFKAFKKELLQDPEVRRQYDELGPEFAVIELMIQKRLDHGISQAELAKKIGTKQSAISRFESGTYHPTLSFLNKVAVALDARLKVTVT